MIMIIILRIILIIINRRAMTIILAIIIVIVVVTIKIMWLWMVLIRIQKTCVSLHNSRAIVLSHWRAPIRVEGLNMLKHRDSSCGQVAAVTDMIQPASLPYAPAGDAAMKGNYWFEMLSLNRSGGRCGKSKRKHRHVTAISHLIRPR